MAKQVQVVVTFICDWCTRKWRNDDEEAPREFTWAWNGTEYTVELCNDCVPKVRDHLQRLFESSEPKKRRAGRPKLTPEQKTTRARRNLPRGSFNKYKDEDGKYQCPSCPRKFELPQHLGNHHSGIHGSLLG